MQGGIEGRNQKRLPESSTRGHRLAMPVQPRRKRFARLCRLTRVEQGPANLQPAPGVEVRVAEQRRYQMPWSRQRCGLQPSRTPSPGQQQGFEASLQEERRSDSGADIAELPHEVEKLGAACEVYMLAIVNLHARHLEGCGLASKKTAPFEELDLETAPRELQGGAEAGQPATHDGYRACSHDLSMTDNFSLLLRAARRLSGR